MTLLRNKKCFETELLLKYLKLKSFKTYKITTIFTHLVAKLHKNKNLRCSFQSRRQDLAAGGPKTRRRGQTPEGGPHFKIQYWMYVTTGDPNVKWGAPSSNGVAGHHWPPLATALVHLKQGFPTFLRSRTTWTPRIVNAYHFFQNNKFDRIFVYSEEWYTLKQNKRTQLNLMRYLFFVYIPSIGGCVA